MSVIHATPPSASLSRTADSPRAGTTLPARSDSAPGLRDHLLVLPLAVGATVNLWKLASIRSLFPFDLTAMAMLAVGAYVMVALVQRASRLGGLGPVLVLLASFLPGVALSSFAQPYSVQKSLQLVTLVPMLLVGGMAMLESPSRRRAFANCLAWLGVAVAVAIEASGTVSTAGRAGLEDANAIALGRMCCVGALCLLIPSPLRRPPMWRIALAALCLHATIITGSRGPLLSTVLAAGIAILLTPEGAVHRLRAPAVRLLPLVLGAAALWPLLRGSRVATAFGGESDQVRLELLAESWRLFSTTPWGIGWGDLVLEMQLGLRNDQQGWAQYPHNILAETAVEGGLVALVALLWVLILTLRALFTEARRGSPTMLALLVMSVLSSLTSSDLTGSRVIWVAMGAGLALHWRARQKGAADPGTSIAIHGGS